MVADTSQCSRHSPHPPEQNSLHTDDEAQVLSVGKVGINIYMLCPEMTLRSYQLLANMWLSRVETWKEHRLLNFH